MTSERLEDALVFTASAFRDVTRKGSGVPYLSHLMQVSVWVMEFGGDEDQVIAGLLHDYLEDIEGSDEADLARRFGARVARLVVALSDSRSFPKPPWKARKDAYLATLRDAPSEVKLISACDKLHNATSIVADHRRVGAEVWDRFTATAEQTAWYYESVYIALSSGWQHPVLELLEPVVRDVAARARG